MIRTAFVALLTVVAFDNLFDLSCYLTLNSVARAYLLQIVHSKPIHNKPIILGMELLVAERAGYPLPIAAQLGHLGGPARFGALHAQSVAAAVGGENRSSIGGVLRRRADIVGLEADVADLEAVVVAHACLL